MAEDVEEWVDSAWIRVHRRCLSRMLIDENEWIEEYRAKAGFLVFRIVNDKGETLQWWKETTPTKQKGQP